MTTNNQKSTSTDEKTKPIHNFKARGIDLNIWENEITKNDRTFPVHKATITKSYKDKDGNWQKAQSFEMNDLQTIQALCQLAFETMAIRVTPNTDVDSNEKLLS